MNKPKATEGFRVAQEIAVIRAALKKCGYCIHKRPKQAAWKVFNSEHCYLLTYQPTPISAWVLHPQNNDADYQTIFRPLAPNSGGNLNSKSPQNWGASAVLASLQVEHLAWI